jgi:hypothetical protein
MGKFVRLEQDNLLSQPAHQRHVLFYAIPFPRCAHRRPHARSEKFALKQILLYNFNVVKCEHLLGVEMAEGECLGLLLFISPFLALCHDGLSFFSIASATTHVHVSKMVIQILA